VAEVVSSDEVSAGEGSTAATPDGVGAGAGTVVLVATGEVLAVVVNCFTTPTLAGGWLTEEVEEVFDSVAPVPGAGVVLVVEDTGEAAADEAADEAALAGETAEAPSIEPMFALAQVVLPAQL
jgi:hypothetical protein